MKHTIDYSTATDPSEKRARALRDTRDYLGNEQFNKLDALLAAAIANGELDTFESFQYALFMLPVSGYPLQAWYETLTRSPVNATS